MQIATYTGLFWGAVVQGEVAGPFRENWSLSLRSIDEAMAQWTMGKIARKRQVRTRMVRRRTGRAHSVIPRNRAYMAVNQAHRRAVAKAMAVGRK